MNKFYKKYKACLDLSKWAYSLRVVDASYLELSAFNSRQAAELLLRNILTECKQVYWHTHSIEYLGVLLLCTNFEFDRLTELVGMSNVITSWKRVPLKEHTVNVKESDVEKCLELVEALDESWTEWVNSGVEIPAVPNSVKHYFNMFDRDGYCVPYKFVARVGDSSEILVSDNYGTAESPEFTLEFRKPNESGVFEHAMFLYPSMDSILNTGLTYEDINECRMYFTFNTATCINVSNSVRPV